MTARERYDVIIIGTGAGGGTLAYHLARAGKRILVLERGRFLPREKANWNTAAVFLENRYHTKEVWTDTNGKELHPGTGYWVGGNTKVYGAALFRLRKEDFGVLHHRSGLSPEWPVKYDTFEPYYTKAERLYRVHGKQGIDPTEPPRSEEYPYPAVSNEPRMQEIQEDLEKLGLRPFPCPLGLQLNEEDRVESRCIRCDTCDGYPCLVHAKSDAEVNCIREVMHLPNVTLLTQVRVTRLLTNATGTAVASVEAEVQGKSAQFFGDIIAVCCGAINSAALLLGSANDKHPNGLANSSDMVGRHFMFHQADAILAIGKEPNRSSYMKTLTLNDFYFGEKDYPFPSCARTWTIASMYGRRGSETLSSKWRSTQRCSEETCRSTTSTAMAFCLGSLQSMSSPALMLDASSSGMPALRQISAGSSSVNFDTSCTMLRAAWPRRSKRFSATRLTLGRKAAKNAATHRRSICGLAARRCQCSGAARRGGLRCQVIPRDCIYET
jgi:hypothetical protein